MIKFSEQAIESLEVIRKEIEQKECSKNNYNHLAAVYEEITAHHGNRRILDMSCKNCEGAIQTAIKSVFNYITFEENGESAKEAPVVDTSGEEVVWVDTTKKEPVEPVLEPTTEIIPSEETTATKSIEEIRREYEEVTGKKPHHKMKAEKMLHEIDEINGNK